MAGQLIDDLPCSSAGVGDVDRFDCLSPPPSPFGVKPCHEFCGSSDPLGIGFGLVVGMHKFLALFVPAGNVFLLDSPRDVFLGGVGQHYAVGHVGIIDV